MQVCKNQTKGLLAKWYLRISRFLPLLKLEYKPGSANVVADALSRAPVMHVETTQPAMQLVMKEQTMVRWRIRKTDKIS